jgi:hypothetical protein
VRQYHREQTGAVSLEFVLGRAPPAAAAEAEAGRAIGACPVRLCAAAQGLTGRGAVAATAVEPAHYEELYPGGMECDLTGRPRSTRVRFVCATDGLTQLAKVIEGATCECVHPC